MEEKFKKFWPKGMPYSLDYPVVPVGEILKGSAHRFGEKAAVIFQDVEYSYNYFYQEALKFANALRDYGIKKGDVVSIHMPNCPQYVAAYYGILLSGATFSPANPLLPPKDLAYQLNDCNAKVVVTWSAFAENVKAVFDETNLKLALVTDEKELHGEFADVSQYDARWSSFQKFKDQGEAKELAISIDPKKDLAHLAYTGGTTGPSKGVMIPHYNVVVNTLQYTCWGTGCIPNMTKDGLTLETVDEELTGGIEEYQTRLGEDRLIQVAPWFHAMGTVGYLSRPFLSGTTLILHQRFDPALYLQDAEKYKVTSMGGAPPMFVALVRHPDFEKRDLSSVKRFSSGAAPLHTELINILQKHFPEAVVVEAYGLTEVTMGVTSNPHLKSGVRKIGSVGIPVFDTEIKIVEPGGSDEALPTGTEGEVCARGPQIMVGYLNKPEETAAVLKDGWLRTGDIGVIDEDGYLTIVDRKKDMLIYKGYNVFPRELEEYLFQHDAVASAAVIGKPDFEAGEIPKAFVVLKPGRTITEQELMEYVNAKVIPYKKIRELEFIDELPVSGAGKILKRVLRDREVEKEADRSHVPSK